MKGCALFMSLAILGSIALTPTAFACLPHISDDVFVARLQAVQKTTAQDYYHLTIKHPQFIFRGFGAWIKYPKAKQWQSHFYPNLKKDDLVIGLAYIQDSANPNIYSITSLARLYCQNDILSIGQPITPFTAWDRKNKNCQYSTSIGLLGGFLAHDQSYYLKKLRKKYPTCQSLLSAFPKL
ncbi:hypothetical protein GPS59_03370 [Acinetobacter haemolyticus]|uniref:hypothetical protein n=1 Tax=Acinetobacter haemolyticus TaxID=29430 RepID=UPI000B29D633|nr:hypothetical protein [Acinetobacter haemolyticus]NAR49759.1 hypothetical protein [Acinetobacter haemolyticus]NAR53063.1 hypothetical protein [Acinetobacter haemolyticus]NCU23961.1 hypothetical protein [Acinetobacter haemolyticus]QHI25113.1 hypothetical protein Ahae2126ch_02110 [Acinetobacter haemolyticus]